EHRDSLVGKELRLLSQVGALAFAPLVRDGFMSAEMLDIWRGIGDLGGLLYVQGIPQAGIEDYTLNLKYAIRNVLLAWAKVTPSIIQSRPKFHVTTHLDEATSLFSVPQCFNEERYEHKHSIARDASMKSNRQRPSFDIATRLADQEMTAHLMSAGYYTTPNGLVRQASPELRGLLASPALSLFRQKYGLEFMESSRTPGATEFSKDPMNISPTLLPQYLPAFQHANELQVRRANYLISRNSDLCHPGSFIHLSSCSKSVSPSIPGEGILQSRTDT
ncbi:hypothetical protein P7C70_g9407, partial [Phenoliferia sp. Uapishka_3]